MPFSSVSPLLCLFLLFLRADSLFIYGLLRCQVTTTQEIVYLEQIYFNNELIGQYNSSLGKYIGYVNYTKVFIDQFNNPSTLRHKKLNLEQCKDAITAVDMVLKPVKPYVRLRSAKSESGRHTSLLVCSVYNFYPKQIRVTWLRNGDKVTSNVTSTEELANGDWFYQTHSYLEYTPRLGEKITCMVEHVSFDRPQLHDWETVTESERTKIAVGASGTLLGIAVLVGGIYYNRNPRGRSLVPAS